MKSIILILILFVSFASAGDFIDLKSENFFIKNRINYINEHLSKKCDLNDINNFFNEFQYKSDITIYGTSEHWATPNEFIISGGGDCEDYAIIKGAALLYTKAVELNKMFIGTIKKDGVNHAVLIVDDKSSDDVLVLDNNINKIYIEKRTSFKLIPFEKIMQKLQIV